MQENMTHSQKKKGKEKERKKKTKRNRIHSWKKKKQVWTFTRRDFKLIILNMFKGLMENTHKELKAKAMRRMMHKQIM